MLLNIVTNFAGNSLENITIGTTIKTFKTRLNFSEIRKLIFFSEQVVSLVWSFAVIKLGWLQIGNLTKVGGIGCIC